LKKIRHSTKETDKKFCLFEEFFSSLHPHFGHIAYVHKNIIINSSILQNK